VCDGNVDYRTVCPLRNFGAPIRQRVLGILEQSALRADF